MHKICTACTVYLARKPPVLYIARKPPVLYNVQMRLWQTPVVCAGGALADCWLLSYEALLA